MVEKRKGEYSINENDKELMEMVKYITRPFGELNSGNKFKVYTLETARGKTTGSIHSIVEDIKKHGAVGKRIVFVSKLKKECIDFATQVNKKTNESYAVAYIPSSDDKEKKNKNITNNFNECLKKKIITLTHSMYLRLCLGDTLRHIKMKDQLEKNFNTLIIDEQIDNVNSTYTTFSEAEHNQVLNIFKSHNEIKKIYEKICEPLLNLIDNNKSNDKLMHRVTYADEFDIADFSIEKECETINTFIEKNMVDESLEDYGIDSNYITTKGDLTKFINGIALFYDEIELDNVLISSEYNTIYTYNSEFEFIKLKNNIWLDASAKFNSVYKLDTKFFDIVDSTRIIDHSNCNFYFHRENTSKSFKSRNDITKFRKEKIKFILDNSKKGSKILILSSKTECIQLEKNHIDKEFTDKFEEYALLNFDNMRGINNYGDYNYCYILQTPRKPIPYYIFLYEYWTKTKLTDFEMETNKINGNEDWGFKNHKALQQLMTDDITSSLYQSCKRIARSSEPVGYFHIFCKIDNAVENVQDQLYNINLNKDGKLTDYDNSKRLKESGKGKYQEWLSREWGGIPIMVNCIKEKFNMTDDNWNYANRDKTIRKIKKDKSIICSKIKGRGNDYYLYIDNKEDNVDVYSNSGLAEELQFINL
ncbi:hypothetical protein [Clostridium estertheticum]|uniref:hypothetical protein n=1 Tax=Clostridium estertheticum TaxID=238834 RepID=UPI00124E4F50|nr:hypothetical protein [Clostridium estertheticum]MBZ9616775.1 hypothetical protein [Clostridium estertheticum subsp. laramiense]WAG72482.1 hypothetical protein LL032_15155 [Clostridium estertheticum]